jgi:hypothetical protein
MIVATRIDRLHRRKASMAWVVRAGKLIERGSAEDQIVHLSIAFAIPQ